MLRLLGTFCTVLIVHVWGEEAPNIPIVNIQSGSVVGSVAYDGDYFEFLGIPYADSTAGSHRFKAPSPPPTFTEPFIASRRGVKCVRALGVGYEGTEDCLVVDVYTPSLNANQSLPVMVWVKGREFDKVYERELSYKNFVEEDVIVVTLNYRESIFGFLCLGTDVAPGNAGLKDIVFGLKWVQENIRQFGGNPNNVTLFGHGSGAAAVDLVTLSPTADGLVHKAIAQSGNALAPWAVSRDNLLYAVTVAEALGHTVSTIEDLSEIFTRVSVSALMGVMNELDLTDNSLAFSPCIEKDNINNEPFLVKSPFQIISSGEFLKIPFMTGFVDKEGTIRAEEAIESEWLNKMENSFADFLQADLKFQTEEERNEVAHNIRTYYFQDEIVSFNTMNNYFTYHGDTMMLVSAIREVRLRANEPIIPVYLYQFSYKGMLGEYFTGPFHVENAGHSEELAYLFHDASALSEDSQIPEMDLTVAKILIERWTNFAKTGNPTSEISDIEWRPFTAEQPSYLRILDDEEVNEQAGGTLEIDLVNPHPDVMNYWDDIYEEHFLDAEGRWELTIRDDDESEPLPDGEANETTPIPEDNDESDNVEGSGEEEEGSGEEEEGSVEEEDVENPPDTEDEDSDGDGEEDGGDGEPDSASTAVGYTFLIISLFAVLDKFHSSQILS